MASTLGQFVPTPRVPQAYTSGPVTALRIANGSAYVLRVILGGVLYDKVPAGADQTYTLANLAGYGGWVLLIPGEAPVNQNRLAGPVIVTSYGGGDTIPYGTVTQQSEALYSPSLAQPDWILDSLRGALSFNVKMFGAAGDGVTDDTAAIQACITACNIAGGGEVYLPHGTYVVQSLTLANYVTLRGGGIISTTLQLKSGTNADLLWGGSANAALINLAAAHGSSQTSGPPIVQDFRIQDLTLDGNKAGQSGGPSYCLRGYFVEYAVQNVRMKNGYSGGVLTDWNGSGVPTGSNSVESTWHNVKIHDCNGIGFELGGPSDSVFEDVIIYFTGSHALHICPNAGGSMLTNVHCWGTGLGVSAVAMLIECGFCYFAGCEAEASDTAQLVILGESNEWVGGSAYASNGGTACVGIQLGQQAGSTPYPGQIYQSAGLTTAVVAQSNMLDCRITECRNGAVNFVNTAFNHVSIRNYQASGTFIAGTRQPSDTWHSTTRYGDNDLWANGSFALGQRLAVQAIGNNWTLQTEDLGVYRANPAANVTGVILPAGVTGGQVVVVLNESAFTITMAASGTSHVADGASDVIPAQTARMFVWDSSTSLWYRLA